MASLSFLASLVHFCWGAGFAVGRGTHTYAIVLPKSGSSSLALWVKGWHEYDEAFLRAQYIKLSPQEMENVLSFDKPRPPRVTALQVYLLQRAERLGDSADVNTFLPFFAPLLCETLPAASFLHVRRNMYRWIDSFLGFFDREPIAATAKVGVKMLVKSVSYALGLPRPRTTSDGVVVLAALWCRHEASIVPAVASRCNVTTHAIDALPHVLNAGSFRTDIWELLRSRGELRGAVEAVVSERCAGVPKAFLEVQPPDVADTAYWQRTQLALDEVVADMLS